MKILPTTVAGFVISLLVVGLVVTTFRYLIEPRLKRVVPRLVEYVPAFIWVFFLGIAAGVLVHVVFSGPELRDLQSSVKLGADAIRDPAIAMVLLVTGGLQASLSIRRALNRTKTLAFCATLGSLGLGVGAAVTGVAVWCMLRALNPTDASELWNFTVRGVTANANAWIGDSTTLVPALAILDDPARYPGQGSVAPHVLVLDQALGIAWFFCASLLAVRCKATSLDAEPRTQTLKAPPGSRAAPGKTHLAIIVFLLAALVGVAERILAEHPVWRTSGWRPLAVVLLLVGIAVGGYFAARGRWFVPDKGLRAFLMLVALASFGVGAGLSINLHAVTAAPSRFAALAVCAVGMFAVHALTLLFVRFWFGTDWGKLAVASMCGVGGLASAPLVAARYSEDYVEASYATALYCNFLSVPISFGVYSVLQLLK